MDKFFKEYGAYVILAVVVVAAIIWYAAKNKSSPQNQTSQAQNVQAASPKPTPTPAPSMAANGSWQGTLELSNDGTKGNLMLVTQGHTIYIKSSRNYSSLIGSRVNVSYSGSLTGFTLEGITAQ